MSEAKCSKCNSEICVVKKCPKCDEGALFDDSMFCTKCGEQLAYYQKGCTNSACIRQINDFRFEKENHFCDMCGEPLQFIP